MNTPKLKTVQSLVGGQFRTARELLRLFQQGLAEPVGTSFGRE